MSCSRPDLAVVVFGVMVWRIVSFVILPELSMRFCSYTNGMAWSFKDQCMCMHVLSSGVVIAII